MIGHAAALDLAGAVPAFPLSTSDRAALWEHLAVCPACAGRSRAMAGDAAAIERFDPGPVSVRLHERIQEAAMSAPRPGPGPIALLVAFVLLGVAVVGASIGVGGFLTSRPADDPVSVFDPGSPFHWQSGAVELAASTFRLEVNGKVFTGRPGATTVGGDPGNLEAWTLETSWTENGLEQRLYLYFAADETSWWIRQISTYDGGGNAKRWVDYPTGQYAKTALGSVWQGDLAVQGHDGAGHAATLAITGVRIRVTPTDPVNAPIGGGIHLEGDAANPFGPAGALRCSGILQLVPRAAEARLLSLGYRLSWRWVYATGTNTGFAEIRTRAPDTGWIFDTAVGAEGELIVFVADPARSPVGMAALSPPPGCASAAP